MSHAADTITTAEELFAVMKEMPTGERVRFFTLLGKNAFEKENFTHEEVFGEVLNSEFTAAEAAEYLDVFVATFRRYVQAKKMVPARVVGRNQFFDPGALKALKKALREVRRH